VDQGASGGYQAQIKDVQGKPAPFDAQSGGLGRSGSIKKKETAGVSLDAESDVSWGFVRRACVHELMGIRLVCDSSSA
jgi:hypothetical protein